MRIWPKSSIGIFSRLLVRESRVAPFCLGLIATLTAVILLMAPAGVFAQLHDRSDAKLKALNERTIELYNAGKTAEAIPLAEEYLKMVEVRGASRYSDRPGGAR